MAGLAALKWPMTSDLTAATGKQKVDVDSTQPLGALAQDLAKAALAGKDLTEASKLDAAKPDAGRLEASAPDALGLGDSKPDISFTQSLELPADLLPQRHVVEVVSPPASPAAEPPLATGSLNEFGELTLLATGEWQAMQRSDTKSETKPDAAKTESGAATNAAATATTVAGNAETPNVAAKADKSKFAELSGDETLSLISSPAPAVDESATEPTIQLAVLADPPVESKRAANGK